MVKRKTLLLIIVIEVQLLLDLHRHLQHRCRHLLQVHLDPLPTITSPITLNVNQTLHKFQRNTTIISSKEKSAGEDG